MTTVYYRGKSLRLDPRQPLAEGGEGIVYDIGNGVVVKLYRQPDDPYYRDNPNREQRERDQAGARLRLEEMQHKLREFPARWSDHVVAPLDVVTTRDGSQVLGYAMPFISGTKVLRDFSRRKSRPPGFDNQDIVSIFSNLHETVRATHKAGVVIGDFNYFNVLVRLADKTAFLIDADSMQFGKYPCRLFTPRFVDPLLCEAGKTPLVQHKPHGQQSDWYAYALMLFESMMLVPVYGGVFEPPNPAQMVELDARPLKRISVFHPGVRYPAIGVPLTHVDDDFLHYFDQLLHKDQREPFPLQILENLRWTTCLSCGTEHARRTCPSCKTAAPRQVVKVEIRGKVRVLRVFESTGTILKANYLNNALYVLYHQDRTFYRAHLRWSEQQKDFAVVSTQKLIEGELQPQLRFGLNLENSFIASSGRVFAFPVQATQEPTQIAVESFRDETPNFAANAKHLYWSFGGTLLRSQGDSNKYIGDLLPNQTRFWVGPHFGFGFYRVGGIQVAFVFDAERQGINDSVQLPFLHGTLQDMSCVFDTQRAWFFVTTRANGVLTNHAFVIDAKGTLLAESHAEERESHWLNDIGGRCAATLPRSAGGTVHVLFAATERGIIRLHQENGEILEAAQYPDTEGIVLSSDELLFTREGLMAITRKGIRCIQFQG